MKYIWIALISFAFYLMTKFICGFVSGLFNTDSQTDNILFVCGAAFGMIVQHYFNEQKE